MSTDLSGALAAPLRSPLMRRPPATARRRAEHGAVDADARVVEAARIARRRRVARRRPAAAAHRDDASPARAHRAAERLFHRYLARGAARRGMSAQGAQHAGRTAAVDDVEGGLRTHQVEDAAAFAFAAVVRADGQRHAELAQLARADEHALRAGAEDRGDCDAGVQQLARQQPERHDADAACGDQRARTSRGDGEPVPERPDDETPVPTLRRDKRRVRSPHSRNSSVNSSAFAVQIPSGKRTEKHRGRRSPRTGRLRPRRRSRPRGTPDTKNRERRAPGLSKWLFRAAASAMPSPRCFAPLDGRPSKSDVRHHIYDTAAGTSQSNF